MRLFIPPEVVKLVSWFLLDSASAASEQQTLFDDVPIKAQSASQWKFNYSSEAPHYFASVHGLLQQWSNTFFPNGHSIVPCEIPPFTKLYHGRMDGDVPPSPEWLAFDLGMSYGIMGGSRNSHMLTYQTTRRTQCLYFDGESATLFGTGQLDSQNLHVWGNVTGAAKPPGFRGLWDEYARATGLCDWLREEDLGGPGWGYEGIVRMNAGFEMIWCNFSSPSARLISHLNITAPLLPGDQTEVELYSQEDATATSPYPLPPLPTRSDKATDPANPPRPPVGSSPRWSREPFFRSQAWSWYTSATLHYGSSGDGPGLGEGHVKPVTCGLLSYYAPEFLSQAMPRALKERKSLNLSEDGLWMGHGSEGSRSKALQVLTRRRRSHTLEDITTSDAAIMRSNSKRVLGSLLAGSTAKCSGVEWTIMTNDIVQTYGKSVINFLNLLDMFRNVTVANNSTILINWMVDVRDQSHAFMLPFLEYPVEPDTEVWKRDSNLFKSTYSLCRFQFTRLLDPREGVFLGPEESLLKWSVEEVTGGICSVLVDIGLTVEGIWEAHFNTRTDLVPSRVPPELKNEVARWIKGVEELMAWLGWAGEWTRCEKKCAWDESCFIPMWPLIPSGSRVPPRYRPGYGDPKHGGSPYGRPEFGRTYPYGELPPNNGTRGRPGRGFDWWKPNEEGLWDPQCVKSDYINRGP